MNSKMAYVICHPTTIIVSGPTMCGKTNFVSRLIKSSIIQPVPQQVIWVYKHWQPIYDTLNSVSFVKATEGILGSIRERLNPQTRSILVLDDVMSLAAKGSDLSKLFTEGAHHLNCTVIYIVQNLFEKGNRTASINTHYFVLFKNARDCSQIRSFASQLAPTQVREVINLFEKTTAAPFSYLLVNCHPLTPEKYRFATGILPGEDAFVFAQG